MIFHASDSAGVEVVEELSEPALLRLSVFHIQCLCGFQEFDHAEVLIIGCLYFELNEDADFRNGKNRLRTRILSLEVLQTEGTTRANDIIFVYRIFCPVFWSDFILGTVVLWQVVLVYFLY